MEVNLGIDDAGRGPVIGPMVLAGCILKKEDEKKLKRLGVKDSKQLTRKRRIFLVEKIKEVTEGYEIISIFPQEIDGEMANGKEDNEKNKEKRIKLNELEAIACSKIINKLSQKYEKLNVFLDCPSISITKWDQFLRTQITNASNLVISCEHKADKNHVSVSAASILAKERREEEMDKLKEKYGVEIGSGYTSDPTTKKFVTKYAQKYQKEGIFRKTWQTWKNAIAELTQRTLDV